MATTKAKEAADTAAANETSKAAGEEKLISIRLPLTKDNQEDVFVRVNRRTWLIKRGETVEVPECVVEVLNHAEDANLAALKFQQAHEKG